MSRGKGRAARAGVAPGGSAAGEEGGRLAAAGMEVGAQTREQPPLDLLDPADQRREIEESAALIERLGYPLTSTSANRAGGPTAPGPLAIASTFGAAIADGRLLVRGGGPLGHALRATIDDHDRAVLEAAHGLTALLGRPTGAGPATGPAGTHPDPAGSALEAAKRRLEALVGKGLDAAAVGADEMVVVLEVVDPLVVSGPVAGLAHARMIPTCICQ